MQPVMITAAMVGAEVTRDAQPNLPTTPQEIVAAAVECYEAGASIIHIHVRDAEGNATQDGTPPPQCAPDRADYGPRRRSARDLRPCARD